MDSYVTGTAIRQLREAKHLTQSELAEKLAAARKRAAQKVLEADAELSARFNQ